MFRTIAIYAQIWSLSQWDQFHCNLPISCGSSAKLELIAKLLRLFWFVSLNFQQKKRVTSPSMDYLNGKNQTVHFFMHLSIFQVMQLCFSPDHIWILSTLLWFYTPSAKLPFCAFWDCIVFCSTLECEVSRVLWSFSQVWIFIFPLCIFYLFTGL